MDIFTSENYQKLGKLREELRDKRPAIDGKTIDWSELSEDELKELDFFKRTLVVGE